MNAAEIELAPRPTPALLGEEIMMIFRNVAPAQLLRSGVAERCRHASSEDHFSHVWAALMQGGWIEAVTRLGERSVWKLGPNADHPLPRMPASASGASPSKPASALPELERPAPEPRAPRAPTRSLDEQLIEQRAKREQAALAELRAADVRREKSARCVSVAKSLELQPRFLAILRQFEQPINSRVIREPLGLSQPVCSQVLLDLERARLVRRVGAASHTRWVLTDQGRAGEPQAAASEPAASALAVAEVSTEPAAVQPAVEVAAESAATPEDAQAAGAQAALDGAGEDEPTAAAPSDRPELGSAPAPTAGAKHHPPVRSEGQTRQVIELLLHERGVMTSAEVAAGADVKSSTALFHLNRLREQGKARVHGNGLHTRWEYVQAGLASARETVEIGAASYAMWSDGRLEIHAQALGHPLILTAPAAKALIDYLDRTYRLHLPAAGASA